MENLIKIKPLKPEEAAAVCTPEAEAKYKLVTLTLQGEGKKILGKKVHDVTSSLRALTFAIEAIEEGYRFDDELAEAKIASMRKAIDALQKEYSLVCEILGV